MRCGRCGGLMVPELYMIEEKSDGWRCVNCGEIVDSRIEKNRRFQATMYRVRQGEATQTGEIARGMA